MKVVLDTNVLVSGLLNPFGAPGEIVRLVAEGALAVCFDARILSEYREVLARPRFGFRQAEVEALLDQLEAAGHLSAAALLQTPLVDREDEPFLAVALGGEARFLIAGNSKHFPRKAAGPVRVVSPRRFLDILRSGD